MPPKYFSATSDNRKARSLQGLSAHSPGANHGSSQCEHGAQPIRQGLHKGSMACLPGGTGQGSARRASALGVPARPAVRGPVAPSRQYSPPPGEVGAAGRQRAARAQGQEPPPRGMRRHPHRHLSAFIHARPQAMRALRAAASVSGPWPEGGQAWHGLKAGHGPHLIHLLAASSGKGLWTGRRFNW